MKSYDMEYGGGGGSTYVLHDQIFNAILHCSKCSCFFSGNKDKYFISRKTFKEKLKEIIGIKTENRYLCKKCHRDEQIDQIV